MGEVHTDSGKMFAVLDSQEVQAVACATIEINFIIGPRLRL
jgi:hypothetical protein